MTELLNQLQTTLHNQTILERVTDMLKISDIPQQVIDRHWGKLSNKENRNKIENEIKSYFNRMIKSYLDFYKIDKKVNCNVEYSVDGEIQIDIAYE